MKLQITVLCWLMCLLAGSTFAADQTTKLKLNHRTRVETVAGSGRYHAVTTPVEWEASRTAIVICDMWNDHYCRNSARRVSEMAPRMNEVIRAARRKGVLIIHSPSGCMDRYADTPQRKLAQQAPQVETKVPLKGWCYLDEKNESQLPVADSEPCDDEGEIRERVRFFDRQIETLEMADGDAITDSAEAYYLMKQRGITNVIVMGVHTNMCVLGRPFGIRQMVYQGQNVVLMRDMTDSMYSPKQAPYVSHFTGNDLINEHVERHWCATVTSADILGGEPFRFPRDKRKHLVIVTAESEYDTATTLPPFALQQFGQDFRISLVYADADDRNNIRGLDVLNKADVAIWSIRRRTPPKQQLDIFRRFISAGKPLVALRTTSHAFCQRNQKPADGLDEWPQFDREVLGGHYQNHHGNKLVTYVRAVDSAGSHPVMKGVQTKEFRVFGSLYRSLPLSESATALMFGRAGDLKPHEPVAWTNTGPAGGKVFYTSLGHPDDFELPDFQRLLRNAVYWAADLPVPESKEQPAAETADSC